jgi:hypothetical protein
MGKTRAEVAKKLTEALRNLDRGIDAPKDERLTLAAFLDSWLVTKQPEVEHGYWVRCETYIRLYVKPALGGVPLVKLNGQQLSRLYAHRLDDGAAPNTVRHLHATIHTRCQLRHRCHVRHWEQVCRYRGAQPYRAVSLPLPGDPPRSARLYKRMAVLRLMRHRDDWRWQLSPRYRIRQAEERLRAGQEWEDLDLVFPKSVGGPIDGINLLKSWFYPLLECGPPSDALS